MNTQELATLNGETLPAMTKENLSKARVGALIPASIEEALTLARTLYMSRLFPDLQNAQQAFVKIVAGAELGLPPIASLNAFHIVKGKIMMHYSTIGGRIRAAGYDYRVTDHTDELCSIKFYSRGGEEVGSNRFDQADAKRAQTQNMEKMPRTMLFARCLAQGARYFVPEAFNGLIVYANEEIEEFAEFAEDVQDAEDSGGTSSRVAQRVIQEDVPDDFDPFSDDDYSSSAGGDSAL